MKKLEGKRALVTGAGSGIGRAIALLFAEEGADIAVNDVNIATAEETAALVERLGRKAIAVKANVAEQGEVGAMVERTISELGGADILVNNAGIGARVPTVEMPVEVWDRVVGVLLRGTFLCSRAVGKWMIANGGGAMVNIASVAGIEGLPERAGYGPAKAGVINMTRLLAVEWARHRIRVNAIAPGHTRTGMHDEFVRKGLINMEQIERETPMGRMAEPEEIARPALFLASDDASYITGITVPVDGGYLCRRYQTV